MIILPPNYRTAHGIFGLLLSSGIARCAIKMIMDLLRLWHTRIEGWMLEQTGIDFVPTAQGLRIVNN